MTQEDKQLLLADLCARLPYGVVVNYNGLVRPIFGIEPTQHFQITLDNALLDGEHNGLVYVSLDVDGEVPKPYLRSMSSITLEELEEYRRFGDHIRDAECKIHIANYKQIDWLNAHHFDYRELIKKNLALEAPDGMYE